MSPRTPKSASSEGVGPVGCRSCDLHEICRLTGLIAYDSGRSRQSTGTLRSVPAGAALYRAGDPAHMLYAVRQGLLKTVHVSAEGDEQVLALNAPGEVLGLEAFSRGAYANDVIALQPVVCCELPMRLLGEHGARVGELDEALIRLLSGNMALQPSPARGPIRQRVTRFLLDLGSRLSRRGLDGRQFALGLSRREIADLLATRIESVSRVMQQLHREQAIRVRGSKVNLLGLALPTGSPAKTG